MCSRRNHVDVGVGHLVAGDDHADTRAIEGPLAGPGRCGGRRRTDDRPDRPVRRSSDRSRRSGTTSTWPRANGLIDMKATQRSIAVHEGARNLAGDDPAEDGCHDPKRRPTGGGRAVDGTCTLGHGAVASNRYLTVPNAFTLVRLCCIPLFLYLLFGHDNRAGAAWLLGGIGRHRLGRRLVGAPLEPDERVRQDVRSDRRPAAVHRRHRRNHRRRRRAAVVLPGPSSFARCSSVAPWRSPHLFFGMKRFDVTWLGKLATFLLMFALPGFMLGASDFPGASSASRSRRGSSESRV